MSMATNNQPGLLSTVLYQYNMHQHSNHQGPRKACCNTFPKAALEFHKLLTKVSRVRHVIQSRNDNDGQFHSDSPQVHPEMIIHDSY